MIAHVLLFRLRAEVPPTEQLALIDAYATAIRDIPSIRRARVGRRILMGRTYEQAVRTDFPYAAILEFDDADGVRAYLDHPAHAEVATRFFAATADTLVYDFEFVDNANGLRGAVTGGGARD